MFRFLCLGVCRNPGSGVRMTIISTLVWRVTRSNRKSLKVWDKYLLDGEWAKAEKSFGSCGWAAANIIAAEDCRVVEGGDHEGFSRALAAGRGPRSTG